MDVSRESSSKVTDAVLADAREWRSQPLDDIHPVVFLDALVLNIRANGTIIRKTCHLTMGINLNGEREVLGLWFQDTVGAKFWMQALTD